MKTIEHRLRNWSLNSDDAWIHVKLGELRNMNEENKELHAELRLLKEENEQLHLKLLGNKMENI